MTLFYIFVLFLNDHTCFLKHFMFGKALYVDKRLFLFKNRFNNFWTKYFRERKNKYKDHIIN
jgi:hypothetical protein